MKKITKKFFKNPYNTGVCPDLRSPEEKAKDYIGIGAVEQVLQQDGQWDNHLPITEIQHMGQETFACVSFSALNCLEILYKRLFGTERNFSDRFTATMSGTRCGFGNYMQAVANSIRHDGLLDEALYPLPTQLASCEAFYAPVGQELRDKAKEFFKDYEVQYSGIVNDGNGLFNCVKKALTYNPLQIVINNQSHAVCCYGWEGDKMKIFDSYLNDKYLYPFSSVDRFLKYQLIKLTNFNNFMSNSKILKVKDTSTVGIFCPAKNEEALISMVENYGLTLPLINGKIDWNLLKIDGEIVLKK